MSAPSESTKPSTTAADNVGKGQHDVPKSGTVGQDTAGDDSLLKSLDAKIAGEDHPAAMSDGSSSITNVVPGADLPTPEIPASPQGADEGEVWIPKGGAQDPNAAPKGQTPRPTRPPSKPKRDD